MLSAVTFDFGQTLAELDTAMLVRRLAERGAQASEPALEAAMPEAWAAYDRVVASSNGERAWKTFMHTLLAGVGLAPSAEAPIIAWLWNEQPRHNLWRRPIPGMIDVARELAGRGVPVGVVSNSEGHLAELAAEIGWGNVFRVIADSGRLGIEKPDPAIYRYAAAELGVPPAEIVHVGDSLTADVAGALAAGERAVWFEPEVGQRRSSSPPAIDPALVRCARDAAEVRRALAYFHDQPTGK